MRGDYLHEATGSKHNFKLRSRSRSNDFRRLDWLPVGILERDVSKSDTFDLSVLLEYSLKFLLGRGDRDVGNEYSLLILLFI